MKSKTIFVSIISFNEEDLLSTVQSAISTARHPERIFFGIVEQRTDGKFSTFSHLPNVKVWEISDQQMKGVGVSRVLANNFYNNESYYLQVDAHTIFDYAWDVNLIQDLEMIKANGIEKPIISFQLPSWHRNKDNKIKLDLKTYDMQPLSWGKKINSNNMITPVKTPLSVRWDDPSIRFIQHYGISSHFLFAEGHFCKDIYPDPEVIFDGNEVVVALQAFAADYKIFVVRHSYMWHKNKMLGKMSSSDRRHFVGSDEVLNREYFGRVESIQNKLKNFLTKKLDWYDEGISVETLKDYESLANVNFQNIYEESRVANNE